jgi:AcrR family transcriptional regulator
LKTATRDALLEAAEQVFAEKAIDGARIEDIAARAGIAVGTFYNYFRDGQELLDALIIERRRDFIGQLDQTMAGAKRRAEPWAAQVEAFIRVILTWIRDHHRFYAILMQCEHRKAPSAMGGVSSEFYDRAEALVRSGVRFGLVDAKDAALLPALLISMCRAPFLHLHHAGAGAPWTDELTDQMVRFVRILIPGHDARRRGTG